MSMPYHTGFSSLEHEVEIAELPVAGVVPSWLRGTLLRNGPARFEVGARSYRHWFDGLAMLHRFAIEDGRVCYGNRFVESPAFVGARRNDRITYAEFATDPCRSLWKRVSTLWAPEWGHNASVHVAKLARRWVALTETPLPIEFDPHTLRTIGVATYDDRLDGHQTTPHPHVDTRSGEAINHMVSFGRVCSYKLYRIAADHPRRSLIASIAVQSPAYIHSFGLTERYAVQAEYPLVIHPLRMLANGRSFAENLHWEPERGARFRLVRLSDGAVTGEWAADAFFCFHHVNAFEDGDDVVVDLLAYPDAAVIERLYLGNLRGEHDAEQPAPLAELRRYRLRPGRPATIYRTLAEQTMELPRINERLNGRPYRYVYATGTRAQQPFDWVNQLLKVDTQHRTTKVWHAEGCYPGEPVFVAAPGASSEDDGVVLSVVLDSRANTSFLLVLDARSWAELARACVPHHIPFGFHGAWSGEL